MIGKYDPGREITHTLDVHDVFKDLSKDDRNENTRYTLYAHHLARACWHTARIVLRQTSHEAEGIFDFILELHKACEGRWKVFCDMGIEQKDLDEWLEFSGLFLSHLGNYFNPGNHKAIPKVTRDTLTKMASISVKATSLLEEIFEDMMAKQPSKIGYPSETSQSNFYPGKEKITKEEIEVITKLIKAKGIASETTRLQKLPRTGSEESHKFHVLQASTEKDASYTLIGEVTTADQQLAEVFLCRGDNFNELKQVSRELRQAHEYASNPEQAQMILQLLEFFQSGDYSAFDSYVKTWLKDKNPRVETTLSWFMTYRDPSTTRDDITSFVGIADAKETERITKVAKISNKILSELPWVIPEANNDKGSFEHAEMEIPSFSVLHVLAFVSDTVWEATNVNFGEDGVKNLVYGNRMSLNSKPGRPCYYAHPSEAKKYMQCAHIVRFNGTVIHEIIGHGSGKLLKESAPGDFNFDRLNLPISPVTQKPIETWYKPKEHWLTVFGNIASSMEECRAFLFAYYLADNQEILGILGYDQHSTPSADDLIYNSYVHIGVEGLRALSSFNFEDQVWCGDHARALFTIFKHILQDGDGVLKVEHNAAKGEVFVRVDRSKIFSHGKPSIERMLRRIQIWHCTADVEACRPFYENLSAVDGEFEQWRKTVASKTEPKWKFVQPNTFLTEDMTVELREYEASNEGIIKSFADRMI